MIPNLSIQAKPGPERGVRRRVKFGAFYEHLEARHAGRFDRVASGHYARLLRPGGDGGGERCGEPPEALLALTRDAVKDQTYFLAGLSRRQLARAMFPLGPLTKVRAWGAALGALKVSAEASWNGMPSWRQVGGLKRLQGASSRGMLTLYVCICIWPGCMLCWELALQCFNERCAAVWSSARHQVSSQRRHEWNVICCAVRRRRCGGWQRRRACPTRRARTARASASWARRARPCLTVYSPTHLLTCPPGICSS